MSQPFAYEKPDVKRFAKRKIDFSAHNTNTLDTHLLVWIQEVLDYIGQNHAVIYGGMKLRWSRLSEQIFRVDKWSLCQG